MRTTVASRESISIAATIRRPHLHPHPSALCVCVSAISIFSTLLNAPTKFHCCFSLAFRFAHFNGGEIIWRFHSTERDGSYHQWKSFDHEQQCNNRKKKKTWFHSNGVAFESSLGHRTRFTAEIMMWIRYAQTAQENDDDANRLAAYTLTIWQFYSLSDCQPPFVLQDKHSHFSFFPRTQLAPIGHRHDTAEP